MLQEAVRHFLKKHHIPGSSRFLIGVSGGADSMAALHICHTLRLKVEVLHCNFKLRGEESEKDALFVKEFCHTHHIPIHIKEFDTQSYAAANHISIEMAARDLRYAWFNNLAAQDEEAYIVIAHHADDVAETVFINLCRGTGIRGLSGIKPVNGRILRPLLSHSREDILQYIATHHLPFRTDSTNDSDDYVRNMVRHRIVPVFKAINPSFLSTIQENCTILHETELLFSHAVEALKKEITTIQGEELLISIDQTLNSPAPYTFLYELLSPYGFNKTQVKDLLDSSTAISGKHFFSQEHTLYKDRNHWKLFKSGTSKTNMLLAEEGSYTINSKTVAISLFPMTASFTMENVPYIAYFDAEKVRFPLKIRNWKEGDLFFPFGMKGRKKKLSDYFTDKKYSLKDKESALLLLTDEEVMWVIGARTDERFKIRSSTRSVLQVTVT